MHKTAFTTIDVKLKTTLHTLIGIGNRYENEFYFCFDFLKNSMNENVDMPTGPILLKFFLDICMNFA